MWRVSILAQNTKDGGTHPLYQEMFKVDVLGFYASLLNDSLPYLEVNYDARIGVLSEVLISSISFALLTTKPFLNGAIRQLEYVTPRVSPFLIERWCISILRAPSDIAPDPSTVAQTIEQAVQALTKLPSVDDAIVEHNLVLRQLDTVQRRMKQSSDVPDIIRDAWLTRSSPSDEDVCASHLCSSVDSNGLLRCVSCMSKYYCSRECQRRQAVSGMILQLTFC
ncbi:hypothetical protein DL93DRAFT_1435173 [Clavulina sp. PMI_390]|nr:hypothetical protein DL93DRAFT_1435173 [Clavulina sp. PMI_390]